MLRPRCNLHDGHAWKRSAYAQRRGIGNDARRAVLRSVQIFVFTASTMIDVARNNVIPQGGSRPMIALR
jgi:hypothetical protein